MMRRLYCLAGLLLLCLCLNGQEKQRLLLSEYIPELEKKFGITFSYDPLAIEYIKIPISNKPLLPQVLAELDSSSAFRFTQIDKENVLVEQKTGGKNLAIKGSVISFDGLALPGAVVALKSQSLFTVADNEGKFTLNVSYPASDSLTAEFIGYATLKISLRQINNTGFAGFILTETAIELGGIVIEGYMTSGINYAEENQSIVLNPDKLGLLPAETETDLYSSLQALPGINSPDDKAGNLTMRGADPDKVLISFDNIPIYHRGHYFGTFSPFNTQVIDEVVVQRSGIATADKGGRVNGYLGMRTKSQIPDSASYSAGLATSYAFANMLVPLLKNKLGLLLGARSSYPFHWNSPKIEAINDFIFNESEIYPALVGTPGHTLTTFKYSFNDLNAKLIYQATNKHKLSLSFLRIMDGLNFEIQNEPIRSTLIDTARLNNWGLNFSIQNKWSSRVNTITEITKSLYHQNFTGYTFNRATLREMESFDNTTDNLKFSSTTNVILKKKQSLLFGYEGDIIDLSPKHVLNAPPFPAAVNGRPDKAGIHSLFTGYGLGGKDRLVNISAGLRLSYYTGTGLFYPEPRILLNFLLHKHFILKSSAGMYYQFINLITGTRVSTIGGVDNINWNLSNNSDIPVVSGRQAMAGFMYSKNKLVLDVETYYKTVQNLTAYNFFVQNNDTAFIYGGYKSFGADVLLKKTIKKFEGWICYSYSSSTARFDTAEFESVWNQPHIVKAVLGYTWKKLKISAGWRYRSGLAALPLIRNPYMIGRAYFPGGSTPTPTPPPGNRIYVAGSERRYQDRFPSTHQLDISVAYKFIPKSKKMAFSAGATVQNVYNNRAITSQIERPYDHPSRFIRVNKYGMGFAPSLIVSVSW